jgi:hypothetical protein
LERRVSPWVMRATSHCPDWMARTASCTWATNDDPPIELLLEYLGRRPRYSLTSIDGMKSLPQVKSASTSPRVRLA